LSVNQQVVLKIRQGTRRVPEKEHGVFPRRNTACSRERTRRVPGKERAKSFFLEIAELRKRQYGMFFNECL
ncbi:MAG: hypothetical protein LBH60_08365, partial [Prevotellaceae bacterium]|nr:hypothetical protein [Prevotellaceae bacterium]